MLWDYLPEEPLQVVLSFAEGRLPRVRPAVISPAST